MTTVSIAWKDAREFEWLARAPKAVAKALAKAGRDAIRSAKTAGGRAVREKKRISVKHANRAIVLSFPRSKEISALVWRMDVSGAPVPVVAFPYRQTRAGVSVAINVGKRTLIRSAFEATMLSGHTGVFLRRTKKRLPIKELFTTRVSDVFNDTGVLQSVAAKGLDAFDRTFQRVLPLELEKLR